MTQLMYTFLALLLFIQHSTVLAINCKMPQTNLAKIICGDYRLSEAHERLVQIYQQQTPKFDEVKKQYKIWLETLERNCETKNKDCLRHQYEQQIRELSQKTWQFQTQVHPDLPLLQFELIGITDEETAHIQKIVISNQDGQTLQTLMIEDVSDMLKETETLWLKRGEGFKIEDVNFDGYKDIRLMELLPAGANVPYLCWLYHPEQQKFVFNKPFSQLAHLSLDNENQQIISQYRINAVEHGTDFYSVDKYELILMRQELLKYIKNDEGTFELFELTKQRVDNELQIVHQELVN
ncbi:hypothetical protein [Candidatus Albibeggiatoa sp. nov. NOAA]|uniref:XAC2610-related protein n=1 Tax=Candidatus Albibeggiatoa sp. nov. NOAA TaxID=3162724 RepID=UPI0032FB67EE|nr:hypothetical protein [Thiotrichaceae bacterium]